MNKIAETKFTTGRWTKFTFWGWLLGVVLILVLSSFLESIGIHNMQFYLGVGMAAGVGFTQWLLLKKFVVINKNWIWFSVLGMAIPFIPLDLLPTGTIAHKLPICITLGALVVGFLQYTILVKHSPKAYLWILGSLFGWTLGVLTVFTMDYTKQFIHWNLLGAFVNLSLILAGGIVLGVITGIALKKILE